MRFELLRQQLQSPATVVRLNNGLSKHAFGGNLVSYCNSYIWSDIYIYIYEDSNDLKIQLKKKRLKILSSI
jgi:hypothetical protein